MRKWLEEMWLLIRVAALVLLIAIGVAALLAWLYWGHCISGGC